MFNKCQSISRAWFLAGKSTYKICKGRSSTCLSWSLVMPPAEPGSRKHPGCAAEPPAQGQSRGSPCLRHPDRFNSQPRSRGTGRWGELSALCGLWQHLPSQGNPCWGCSWCPSSRLLQGAGSSPPELWKCHFLPLLHVQSEAGKQMPDMQLAPISEHAQPAHPQAGNTSGKAPRPDRLCLSPQCMPLRTSTDMHRTQEIL